MAALNLARSTRKKAPENPALLTLQSELELELNQPEQLAETLDVLLRVAPNSTVAKTIQAVRAIEQGQIEDAVAYLQDALEANPSEAITYNVYEAIGLVGQALLMNGHLGAAFAHLAMHAAIAPSEDLEPREILMKFCRIPGIPIAFRYFRRMKSPPGDAPWKSEAEQAIECSYSGQWRRAADMFESLHANQAADPSILFNLAVARLNVCREAEAMVAFRELGRLSDIALDDAVEAEAVAQFLDLETASSLDRVRVVFEISDLDGAMERLLSDRRCRPAKAEAAEPNEEDQPPPRAAFLLLDRDPPGEDEDDDAGEDEDIAWRGIPIVVGELVLYGKQTDREARLELTTIRDQDFDVRKSYLTGLLDDLAREESEDVVAKLDAAGHAMTWRWAFPEKMTLDRRREAILQKRRHALLESWPTVSMGWLDGKSPSEVVGVAAAEIPLQAAILNLKLQDLEQRWDADLNALREQLQLPILATIEGPLDDIDNFPLERLPRVDPKSLDNEDLLTLFSRAFQAGFTEATGTFVEEMRSRDEGFRRAIKFPLVLAAVASAAANNSIEALRYLTAAREESESLGMSPAQFMLASIPHHLDQGNIEEVRQLMMALQRDHIEEPGVAQGLNELVSMLQSLSTRAQAAVERSAGESPPADGLPAAQPESKIWTPGSDAPSSEPGEKSKIWVPGMD